MLGGAAAVALTLGGFLLGRVGPSGESAPSSTESDLSATIGDDSETLAPETSEPTQREEAVSPTDPGEREPRAVAAAGPRCPRDMVFVGGGKFFMGTDSSDPVLARANPAHQVTIDGYCIDRIEVTVGLYRECSRIGECKRAFRESWWPLGSSDPVSWEKSRSEYSALCNESYDDRDQHPINCVAWSQAASFCQWRGGALPTEAQWEYAARGTDGRTYPWGDAKPDSERLNGCGAECRTWREQAGLDVTSTLYEQDDGFPGTAPVGAFAAGQTGAGIMDMAGNVFEWTASEFEPYSGDAPESEESPRRVIRGGGFNSGMPQFADPAFRFAQQPKAHTHGIGFRCAAPPIW